MLKTISRSKESEQKANEENKERDKCYSGWSADKFGLPQYDTILMGQSEAIAMREFTEAFRKLGDPEDRFDIDFWQKQGPEAIFKAVEEMVVDAEFLRTGRIIEPRLDRSVESFRRM